MKFLTDNLELVKRSQAHLEYTLPYSNNTLSSEYDVTEQIFLSHQTYGINASFHHVYGHQDNKIEYTDLPTEAKLNCDTDQLAAGEYQDRYGSYRPVARLLPSCPAVINIRGLTITSNLRHQLQKAYLEPQYIGHLQHKNKWSNTIISSIAWRCLALAIRRIQRDVLLVKICNDLLPTAVSRKKRKYQAYV